MRIVALCFLVRPMRKNVSIPKLPDPQIFLTGKKLTHRPTILHRSRKKF